MKIMTIIGTRPEGIKMAPVLKALREETGITSVLVNTGQHREQLDQVLELFDLTPDYELGLMKSGQPLEALSARMIEAVTPILKKEKPDWVLVHGDTTTTFIGAYAAFLQQIPIAHVEAGLRTYNLQSPFPEELNRQLVGRMASYHFAATDINRENLLNENIDGTNIDVVGNTVIDALFSVTERPYTFEGPFKELTENGLRTILVTTHRRENLDAMTGVYEGIEQILNECTDAQAVVPMHKNPLVRSQIPKPFSNHPRVHLVEPLDYDLFCHLMKHATLIITDSGGIQEEAPSLGKPVLVTRDTTERGEGVASGTLRLVGTDPKEVHLWGTSLLENPSLYRSMSMAINPYGDGEASTRIVERLSSLHPDRK